MRCIQKCGSGLPSVVGAIVFMLMAPTLLWAQGPLIPYRYENLWGFSDTNLNVIIPPRYDAVSNIDRYPPGFVVVEKTGLKGVMHYEKEILPTSFANIRFDEGVFIDGLHDTTNHYTSRRHIYNLRGELLINDTLWWVGRQYSLHGHTIYTASFTDGRHGLFSYDADKQEITQWIYLRKSARLDATSDSKHNAYAISWEEDSVTMYRIDYDSSTNLFQLVPASYPEEEELTMEDGDATMATEWDAHMLLFKRFEYLGAERLTVTHDKYRLTEGRAILEKTTRHDLHPIREEHHIRYYFPYTAETDKSNPYFYTGDYYQMHQENYLMFKKKRTYRNLHRNDNPGTTI